jgi:hypothetical protein
MKIEIKHWLSGTVLFAHDAEKNTIKLTLEAGVKAGARLDGASLDGARLVGARLVGASLVGARLDGASLDGASLDGASLDGASLDGASLDGARLVGARLVGASLVGARLVGARLDDGSKITKSERPVFQLGGIGSSGRYFVAHITDKGIRLRTGCFFGTVEAFKEKLKKEHGDNNHAQEYLAALVMIEAHFKIWK